MKEYIMCTDPTKPVVSIIQINAVIDMLTKSPSNSTVQMYYRDPLVYHIVQAIKNIRLNEELEDKVETDKHFDKPCEICGKKSCCYVVDFIEYRRPGQIKIDLQPAEKHCFCSDHFRESKIEIIQLSGLI